MSGSTKIAILEPGREETGKYFSLRLKRKVIEEHPIFNSASKILVLSGFDGKFKALQHALIRYGVINDKGKWLFEDGHLVVFGGSAEFGTAALACHWYLYALEERALKKGGRVHYIASMAEITGINTTWTFSQPLYPNSFSGRHRPYAILYDGNNEIKRWLITKNIIEKIGPLLFVNGAIPPNLIPSKFPLVTLNKNLREYYSQHQTSGLNALPDENILYMLASQYQAECIITAIPGVDPVFISPGEMRINVSSFMNEDFAESLMIVRDHYYRYNTKGEKERLK